MKAIVASTIAGCLLGSVLLLGQGQAPAGQAPTPAAAAFPPCLPNPPAAPAVGAGQGRGAAPAAGQAAGRGPAQPQGPREVTVTAIPGVVAQGVKWAKVWQTGGNNADGVVADKDGNLLFAQEDNAAIIKIDAADKASVYLSGTNGGSSLAIDQQGRIYAVLRAPQPGNPNFSNPSFTPGIAILAPERRILADTFTDGTKHTGRPSDIAADSKGGAYFTQACLYYAAADGKIRLLAENIRTNGIVLSPDNNVLYVTNGGPPGAGGMPGTIVAFDIKGTGTLANRRTFTTLERGNGDGIAVDSAGRLYVTADTTVQIFDKDGKHLGTIPTPRVAITMGFAGPDRKTLYVVGRGAEDAIGQPIREGVQQTAATLYKLPMIAAGLKNRGK